MKFYFEDLPKAIVINEAIELSKKMFNGAPKFINGLLDKVVKWLNNVKV